VDQGLQNILSRFDPVSLKEMDAVKLMDRTDTKFTFNVTQLNEILSLITNDYRILEIEGRRQSTYKTLYYDTDNFNMYLNHHNGHLNRYKIRHRTYVDSSTGFLEVKFKNNKGRTIKERIKQKITPMKWEQEAGDFLTENSPYTPGMLKPSLWVNYKRITLVSKTNTERVTIDVDLEFIDKELTRNLSNLVIAEVKLDKKSPSVFLKRMREMHIREGSISKYCMGIALIKPRIKTNNFKEKLASLKHIIYGNRIDIANS
jgi:hypothetical protein